MRVVHRDRIETFQKQHADTRGPLAAWLEHVSRVNWNSPKDVQKDYGDDVILPKNRAVFNVKGNKIRIVTALNYKLQIIDIRFVGTHAEYDRIDALSI
jgi:mRNA interferase HigB